MKSLSIFIICFLMGTMGAIAQSSFKTSVYFASGKHQLDAKAEKELQAFIEKIQSLNDFDIDMKAYTDDVGSMKYNKQLAKKRASSVQDFLAKASLNPTTNTVEGIGEIELTGEEETEKERESNRRVDIVVSAFMPSKVSDLFNYLSKRNQNIYEANNETKTIITGRQGTMIEIPANAFVDADGNTVTDVQITLKEAYSYGDMLLHNLGTTAGDKLLETGGMVYIDAQTPDGQQLQLKDGQMIDVRMPSDRQLPNDMQLFLSDRGSDASTTADWQAAGTPFVSRKRSYVRSVPSYREKSYSQINPDTIKYTSVELPTFPKLPDMKARPNFPTAPEKAYQNKMEEPVREGMENKYKRRRGESKRKYAERIEQLYEKLVSNYEQVKIRNKARRDAYTQDSLKYEAEKVVYYKKLKEYEMHLATYEPIRAFLLDNHQEIDSIFGAVINAPEGATYSVKDIKSKLEAFDGYIDYLEGECADMGLDSSLMMINDLDVPGISVLRTSLKELSKRNYAMRLMNGYKEKCDNKHNGSQSVFHTQYDTLNDSENAEEIARAIHRLYLQVETFKTYKDKIYSCIDRYNQVSFNNDFSIVPNVMKEYRESLVSCYDRVIAEKRAKGILSEGEMQQYFMNSVRTPSLGWINCDRFISFDGEKMMLALNHEHENNTSFYLVFKDIQSVLPLSKKVTSNEGQSQYSSTMYSGIPRDIGVKLVGFKIKDNKTYTFSYEGKAEDINDLTVEFKEGKLDDVRAMLDNV
ncbi:MAG: OmpA family protein [Saprospiraceae bacterium]|nr:OmpA family protein [Saprospiraceae bacterium]